MYVYHTLSLNKLSSMQNGVHVSSLRLQEGGWSCECFLSDLASVVVIIG